MSEKEPTNLEIMDFLRKMDSRLNTLENNHFDLLGFLQEHMVTKIELKTELGKLDYRLRDYVDRKIGDLRGDLVQVGVL